MHRLNRSCFIIIISVLLFVSQVTLADEDTTPEITSIAAAITDNNTGTIAVTFQDADGAETVDSIHLRIGNSSNKHAMYVFVDLKNSSVKIRTDENEWKEWNQKNKNLADDYFTIIPAQIQHSCHEDYGWLVIPIRFKTDSIFQNPESERFRIAATARDAGGNKSDYFNVASIKLTKSLDIPNAPFGDLYAPFYKWNGWGGKELEVSLIWTHCDFDLEDSRRYHRVRLVEYTTGNYTEWLLVTKDGITEILADNENRYEVRDLNYDEADSRFGFVSAFQFKVRRFDGKPLPFMFRIDYLYYWDDKVNNHKLRTICTKSLVPTWWLAPIIDIIWT